MKGSFRGTPTLQVGRDDFARVANLQLCAFVADPIMRWMWRDAHDYATCFPRLVQGFGGGAFENDGADVAEGFEGGALWLRPGVHPDGEALEALFAETIPEPTRSEIGRMLDQMEQSHPEAEHWHLAFIGVDAAHQGKGIGADLMRDRLKKIDALGHHAYLESSNPRNVPFYQRHGFEIIREIQEGGSPPIIPMVRVPRKA